MRQPRAPGEEARGARGRSRARRARGRTRGRDGAGPPPLKGPRMCREHRPRGCPCGGSRGHGAHRAGRRPEAGGRWRPRPMIEILNRGFRTRVFALPSIAQLVERRTVALPCGVILRSLVRFRLEGGAAVLGFAAPCSRDGSLLTFRSETTHPALDEYCIQPGVPQLRVHSWGECAVGSSGQVGRIRASLWNPWVPFWPLVDPRLLPQA